MNVTENKMAVEATEVNKKPSLTKIEKELKSLCKKENKITEKITELKAELKETTTKIRGLRKVEKALRTEESEKAILGKITVLNDENRAKVLNYAVSLAESSAPGKTNNETEKQTDKNMEGENDG